MASIEEDMRLGDLAGDMHDHTDRLGWAMPWTLVLFALAAFASAILWIVYASSAGINVDQLVSVTNKANSGTALDADDEEFIKNSYREQMGYEGAVIGFLIIISYAVVYGALKIAHRK